MRPRVDIHCHCLPALDDGPQTTAGWLALCRALVADDVTVAVATPHQLGRYDGRNSPAEIRLPVASLNALLLAEGMPVRVAPGADVRIDERIPALLERDEVMTLNDAGKYILMELPHETFINPQPALPDVRTLGICVILTHPEQCERLARNPDLVLPWVEQGLVLQATAGSLLGRFGPLAEAAAWYWLSKGAISLVASDAHDTVGRRPCMSQAMAAIASRLGADAARRVCTDNPLGVLRGMEVGALSAGVAAGGGR